MPGLEKMTIIAYENNKFQGNGSDEIEVLINPEKYAHGYKICYSRLQAMGSAGASMKFNRVPASKVSFELVFDGTGIAGGKLPSLISGLVNTVTDQLDAFRKIVVDFNSDLHSPNFVQLSWGTLVFNCRLTSLDISYTLFSPDGDPLRAKADVTFEGYESPETLARLAKKKSPDLTRILRVREGDTLPLLCFKVYGDPGMYIRVAEQNKLADFRRLVPDTDLLFPPIEK